MNVVDANMHAAASSPRVRARAAGFFYLLNIVTIWVAIALFRGLIASNDPALTASNRLAHGSQYRLAVAFEILSTASSVVVAALLYELLKPVDEIVSLLAAFFRLTACAVAVVGYVFQLAPVRTLGAEPLLTGLPKQELPAIALMLQKLHGPPSDIVIVFFGFHFILIGYLIARSSFLPRALAWVAMVAGIGGLTFLWQPLAQFLSLYVVAVPGLLVEVSLTVWLLTVGVDEERWREQAKLMAVPHGAQCHGECRSLARSGDA